jgi:hypothetical protein
MTYTIARFFCNYNIFFATTYQKRWQWQVECDTIIESNRHMLTPSTLTTLVVNVFIIIVEGHFLLWSMCEWTPSSDVA